MFRYLVRTTKLEEIDDVVSTVFHCCCFDADVLIAESRRGLVLPPPMFILACGSKESPNFLVFRCCWLEAQCVVLVLAW